MPRILFGARQTMFEPHINNGLLFGRVRIEGSDLEVLLILDIMFINGEGVRWSLAWVDPSVPALK